MAELKKLLNALIKGKGSFEQVDAALQQALADSPDKAPQIAKLLRATRDAGLPRHMYAALSGMIPAQRSAKSDADATVGNRNFKGPFCLDRKVSKKPVRGQSRQSGNASHRCQVSS